MEDNNKSNEYILPVHMYDRFILDLIEYIEGNEYYNLPITGRDYTTYFKDSMKHHSIPLTDKSANETKGIKFHYKHQK